METVEITIKLPKDEHDALVKDANENFRTVEGQIRWAIHKAKTPNIGTHFNIRGIESSVNTFNATTPGMTPYTMSRNDLKHASC